MKKINAILLICGLLIGTFTGCGNGAEKSDTDIISVSVTETSEKTVTEKAAETSNKTAGEDEKAPETDLGLEGLTPLYGDSLKDGVYDIKAESSSSMFKIDSCKLTVENGSMTAVMTMSGTGYLYLFMGKGADADESGYIPFAEDTEGKHTYTVPVKALDAGIECSAFSRKKEKWYDRTIVFRSSSLPLDAFAEGSIVTAESLSLADGKYTVGVTLSGGSGRAYVKSPAEMTVENGKAFAEIEWSSSAYDYMVVNGEKFELIGTEGNSSFNIPVLYFDRDMPVSADTTAMSVPHEIEYTLHFDSSSIK